MKERTAKQKRRADLLLILGCLLLAGAALLTLRLLRQAGGVAVVYVDGVRTAEYPLNVDTVVTLRTADGSSFNTLTIRDGRADVTDAGCPDKLCVKMHSIRYVGETITCLPNRTVIRIEGGESSGVDVY